MDDRFRRVACLVDNMPAELAADGPWIVVATAPATSAGGSSRPVAQTGDDLQFWVRRQVAVWPAPIPIGVDQPQLRSGGVTFASAHLTAGPAAGPASGPAVRYHCALEADGSSLFALAAGALRDSPGDGAQVWALGEGALAWLTVATLRLAAAYAEYAGAPGHAVVQLSIASYGPGGGAVPYEVWNHGDHGYAPAGRRLARVEPARRPVDLAACLSADLTKVSRAFVVEVLRQFGLAGSRHFTPTGALRCRNFTGYDERIRGWAEAIGVPFEL
ncbi:hypothetical protein EDC02_0501 [Micromonospora sp. Llam0]|uniref:hypothetical protein n=1 Tax=Micromonospora sp. Llam0 TaxID=2485143 RepID=UPI000F9F2378|nr:hypothetical protein [Micromonospora sp. Llam0]ROO58734.1 hypothetical protein EDC02_0501 [Micromonospora sp. Llam0]